MYVRDANGNPTGVDYSNGTGVVVAESHRLTYDAADRLTKVCQTVTACAIANQTVWSYDKNGNRLTEKVGAAVQSVYTYDMADQLAAVTGPGAKTFTYNANGDQITSGADVSTFNTARQTTGATVGGIATTFGYDGNGNRHTISTGGVATAELWDTVGGLPNLALERDAAGVVQRRFTYGRGTETLGYTDPIAATQGWYQTDALGSVANITNSSGAAVATYTYNPFGVARVSTSSPGFEGNPLKYTGQHLDPTGNYNLRARQYNPGLGRFTQTDPLPYGAGTAFEGSYVYAGVRPTVMTDPGGKRFGFGGESFLNSGASNPVQPQPWVATWSISPSGRDWGRFALRAFISTASSGGWIAGSAGDDRSFSSSATCSDSRACIDVDFAAGRVRLEVNTSCNPGKTKCVKPASGNRMSVSGSASSLKLNYHLVNPKAPGNSPAIDGEWK